MNKLLLFLMMVGSIAGIAATTQGSASQAVMANGVMLKNCKMTVRQESQRPPGEVSSVDRPRGFAVVFLDLENKQAIAQPVTIRRLEVQDSLGRVQFVQERPVEITLGGLEYSSQDFHLQHLGQVQAVGKLRAIVYYQAGGTTGEIMSDFVALEMI
ncbi:MAG: hypothetical protein HC860_08315 [Alkalinema sp. RU_4_3]|nr:hypothetical protein [Alkalinema sp. RU_4_3]